MQISITRYLTLGAVLLVPSLMLAAYWISARVHRSPAESRWHVPVADAERGKVLIQQYGCSTCHTVPGVAGARGKVGPRLDQLKEKAYVGGVLPNNPQNLIYWIQHPRDASPRTAMPDLSVVPRDARDIAAYLYSLP